MTEGDNIPDILTSLKQSKVPFTTPEGYFNSLNQTIVSKIEEAEKQNELNQFPNLLSANKEMPYSIPEQYFTSNWVLSTFANKTPYQVPDDYFSSFNQKVLDKRNAKIKRSVEFSKWYQVAVAAAIIAFVLLTAIKFSSNISQKANSFSNTDIAMQKISSDALASFVDLDGIATLGNSAKSIDENQLFKNVSKEELEDFLNETGIEDGTEYLLN